jgi:hypothetical protein
MQIPLSKEFLLKDFLGVNLETFLLPMNSLFMIEINNLY